MHKLTTTSQLGLIVYECCQNLRMWMIATLDTSEQFRSQTWLRVDWLIVVDCLVGW
jgi:hypothetical protein